MSDDRIISEIADELGRMTDYWGLSAVPGRLWMTIYFQGPMTQDELKKALRSSSGAISQAITLLTNFGLIQVSGKKGRKNIYEANSVTKAKRKQMEYALQFQIQPMRQLLSEKQKECRGQELRKKIDELEKMYSRAEKGLQFILKFPFGK